MVGCSRCGIVIRNSLTVFFSIFQYSQNDDGAIILTSRDHSPIALATFFVGHFVNADGAQVLDFVPVDFLVYLSLQGTQNGIVAEVFFETDISYRAADE